MVGGIAVLGREEVGYCYYHRRRRRRRLRRRTGSLAATAAAATDDIDAEHGASHRQEPVAVRFGWIVGSKSRRRTEDAGAYEAEERDGRGEGGG